MSDPLYQYYGEDEYNRETLVNDTDFINDATEFLVRREELDDDEILDNEAIYDRFLEHFRFQNVNEVTAVRDLMYAQEADDTEKARMLRLMDTYDKVDNEYNLAMVGDYAAGIVTAPSTYASLFSFGAGSVGAQAAKAGVKYGIREALKAGLRTSAGAAAVEGAVGAGQAAVQEQTRVEIDPEKESIDPTMVALGGAVSAVTGGVLGMPAGAMRGLDGFREEQLFMAAKENIVAPLREANKKVQKVKASKTKESKALVNSADEIAKKVELEKTIPEILGYGRELRTGNYSTLTVDGVSEIEVLTENISFAAAELVKNVKPLTKERVAELGLESADQERITSKIARSIYDGSNPPENIRKTLDKYGITQQHLSALFAAEVSAAGRLLGQQSAAKKTLKNFVEAVDELQAAKVIDDVGSDTVKAEVNRLEQTAFSRHLNDLTKARVGIMTTQVATTVRNMSSGYLRNYLYALDNLGTGSAYVISGAARKVFSEDEIAKKEADAAVRLGMARLKVAGTSLVPADMFMGSFLGGVSYAEARALKRIVSDPMFQQNKLVSQLFRELADVGSNSAGDGPLVKIAMKMNVLNRASDNMFKRAIFARELDIRLKEAGKGSLRDMFKEGDFRSIDEDIIKKAMYTSMEFTFQNSFRRGEGKLNSFAAGFIDTMSTPLGSLFIPFPRYMASAAKFAWEHTPVLGLVNVNKPLSASGLHERIGKQVAGLGLLGALYALRSEAGPEGIGSFSYKDPTTDKMIQANAMLGPYAFMALIADWLYAKYEADDRTYNVASENFIEALTGGQYRNNSTLTDSVDLVLELVQGIDDERTEARLKEAIARGGANVLGAFTVPAGMLRDLYLPFDEEYRTVTDNTDVDFLKYFMMQTTKIMPRKVGETTLFGAEVRPLMQPTRSGETRRQDPLLRQILGLEFREAPTPVEREFERLGFNWTEYAPKNVKGGGNDSARDLTNQVRGEMGRLVEDEITKLIFSREYQRDEDAVRRKKIKTMLTQLKGRAMDNVASMEAITNSSVPREEKNRLARALFFNKSKVDRNFIISVYNSNTTRPFDYDKVGEKGYADYVELLVHYDKNPNAYKRAGTQ